VSDSVKIPSDRIAALIGTKGNSKKKIEELTNCTLDIDSESGEIEIDASKQGSDFYSSRTIIRAVGRGFSPETALLLLDDDMLLDVIPLEEYMDKGQFESKKARVIGKKGSIREELARKTECEISVYGKTISIIGNQINMPLCRKAIEMLLEGASHNSTFQFIEKKSQETEFVL
jgi:ribosomal RNA assembly protein